MAVSAKEFVTHLTQSGVMAEADVTAFEQSLASPPQTGEEFAKALIKHNRLTKFQAQRIYHQGKYKRLVLGDYVVAPKPRLRSAASPRPKANSNR